MFSRRQGAVPGLSTPGGMDTRTQPEHATEPSVAGPPARRSPTPRAARKAAGRLRDLIETTRRRPSCIEYCDFERLFGGGRDPETVRRDWERTKATLEAMGAPVQRERDGREVYLRFSRRAWAFTQEVLLAPCPARRTESRRQSARRRRAEARARRRQEARELWLEYETLREIAELLEVSVGTVHADLTSPEPRWLRWRGHRLDLDDEPRCVAWLLAQERELDVRIDKALAEGADDEEAVELVRLLGMRLRVVQRLQIRQRARRGVA